MATKTTLKFDTESCSRCGGTGHYSRCQRYGTTCFKCGGRTVALTKAAAKASAAITAFKAEHFSVAVEALVPGDRFTYDGRLVTVAAITTTGGSRFGSGKDPVTGETLWTDYVNVTFTKPVPSALGPVNGAGLIPGTLVVRAISGADWDRVIAFARTLKKGVTVVEAV